MERIILKSRPFAIYGADGQRYLTRCGEVIKGAIKKATEGTFGESDIDELRFFPESLKALVLYNPLQDILLQELATVPSVAFDVIMADYDSNASYLETSIYNCPELIYKLLVWSKETGQALRYPHIFYSQLLFDDIVWAIRWSKEGSENYRYRLLDFVEENRYSEPGSACLYLHQHPKESASHYNNVISSNWKYSLMAAVYFKDRGIDLSILQADAVQQPQWAYHFLKYVPGCDVAACEESLVKHPGWLVEYLTTNPQLDRKAFCTRAVAQCSSHPLFPDLKAWMEENNITL